MKKKLQDKLQELAKKKTDTPLTKLRQDKLEEKITSDQAVAIITKKKREIQIVPEKKENTKST